ncbi:hypothetical protein [Kitasatospora cathayae]|uniref:hypothetical protein n=1 Tax=Kitasatospora cathayae TaxID=3004092 RepID=UPI002FD7F4EA
MGSCVDGQAEQQARRGEVKVEDQGGREQQPCLVQAQRPTRPGIPLWADWHELWTQWSPTWWPA